MLTHNQSHTKRSHNYLLRMIGGLFLAFTFARMPVPLAQEDPPYIGEVRIFDPDFNIPHAFGLAFSPRAGALLLLANSSVGQAGGESASLTMISLYEDLIGTAVLPVVASPINLTFDALENSVLLFDPAKQELVAVHADEAGYPDTRAVDRYEAGQFGIQNPQGMAVNPVDGSLYILDEAAAQIVVIEGGANSSLAEMQIFRIDLSGLVPGPLRGLAFNPANGHLYVMNPDLLNLYEINGSGEMVSVRDLSVLDLGFRDPQGIVFAPSADTTDAPSQLHLFLLDSGLGPLSTEPCRKEGGRAEAGPARIIEFSLTPPVEIPQTSD